MNFAIRYLTEYKYDADVVDNLNALRVKPAANARQRCRRVQRARSSPRSRLRRHTDYFGTEVIEFGVSKPHRQLSIDVRARVVTSPPPPPPDAELGGAGGAGYREAAGEFLLQTDDAARQRGARRADRASRGRRDATGDRRAGSPS